jgi:exodeoxyribonuclease V beta subunit
MPNPFQLHESEIRPGLTVIEASAGTGKTYSISHLVPRLLLNGTLDDLSKLLLVTFTKDAARELADRTRQVLTRLGAPPSANEAAEAKDVAALRMLLDPATNPGSVEAHRRLQRALTDLDLLTVSTIHAFCQRTLQQEGALCGLPVMPEVVTDDFDHLEVVMRQRWIDRLIENPTLAAVATGLTWQLKNAITFAKTQRSSRNPVSVPGATEMKTLLDRIPTLTAQLANDERWSEFENQLEAVPSWRADGPEDSADAISRIHALHTANPESAEFWAALKRVEGVVDRIGGGKAVVDTVKACAWFQSCQDLDELSDQLLWAWLHQLAAESLPRVEATLLRHRAITQDGLIGTLHDALHRKDTKGATQSDRLAKRLADRYQVALIDESQDTDPKQFAIFRRIFLESSPPRHLIIVGDPKQAIYGFRGADLATYLAARDTTDRVFTLTKTFRAPAPLVAAVNQLFNRPQSFLNPGMTFAPAESALSYNHELLVDDRPRSMIEVWILPSTGPESFSSKRPRIQVLSDRVATTITDLLNRRAKLRKTDLITGEEISAETVCPDDFAVLVSTHEQAEAMAEALQSRGVPAVVNSGADVFGTDEARELLALLRAILRPRKKARLRSALATRLIGLDGSTLATLNAGTPDPDSGETPESTRWLDQFSAWQRLWQKGGLAALFAELENPPAGLLPLGVTHRLALIPLVGERRATNYRHLTDLLLQASREDAPRPDEIVRWLAQQITRAESRSEVEETQLQLSTDRHAVQVVTMHKSKGLEYPLVFCPYLADAQRKPGTVEKIAGTVSTTNGEKQDQLVNTRLLDEIALGRRKEQLANATLEERLRLAYVALTRAKVRVWTCSYTPSSRGPRISPLDWILRPANELTPLIGYTSAWEKAANTNRSARHETVLLSLGAKSHEETPSPDVPDTPLITFRALPDSDTTLYAGPAVAEGTVQPEITRAALNAPQIPGFWRVTSFSTLTREKHAHGAPVVETSGNSEPSGATAATPAPTAPVAFFTAPGGAEVGTVVHDWIEAWDFRPVDTLRLEAHLKAGLRLREPREGQSGWTDLLSELFTTLRTTQLPGCDSAPLHELCPAAHASEWHFHLPLKDELTPRALADCFSRHAAPAHQPYAERLRTLSDWGVRGLLQGFIDRLVRHGDTWGVIDWKTNLVGRSPKDYEEESLLTYAMDSHYILQCHLYLVALRRHLRTVGRPSDQANQAWLIFLRGIAANSSRGVLHIQPPERMMNALDALFADPATP